MFFWHLYNFYSPAFIALVFIGLSIYDICTASTVSRAYAFSRRWRPIAFLSFVITLTFIARVVERIINTPEVVQSSLSHALSQTLLWITLFLITSTASFPAPIPHLTIWLLSFLVEASIFAATFVLSRQAHLNQITTAQLALQLLTVVQLLALSVFGIVSLCTKSSVSRNAERQPLLADMDTPTGASEAYSDDDFSQASSDDEDNSSEDSSSDTDEKELKAIRQHKLQEAGGWVGYLKSFKVFIPFVVPARNPKLQLYVAIILLITLLKRALNVIHPYQLGLVIDKLTTTRRIPWANVVIWMASAAAASPASGLGAITDMLQERLAAWSHQQIKVAAYDKIMSLSMSFHDSKESGEIMKAVEQAGALSSLFRLLVLDILPGLLDVIIAMWFINHLLDFYAAHIVIAVVVAFVFTTVFISRLTAQARRTVSGRERDESKLFYETIGNWSTVSYFNRKQHEISRLAKVVAQVASSEVRSNDVYVLLFAVQDACELLGYFAVLLLALYRIVAGTSSIGTFFTLENYWETITMPLYDLGYSYRQVSSDMVDAERLIQLFETDASVKDKQNAYPINVSKGEVEFNNVAFAYDGRTNTIHNLTFKARPGQTIAFVGETGGGKSTIFKLVMRFFDLDGGRITIDGHNIADVTIDSLREVFGIVPQDPVLFNTSILENVRYGRLDATDTEVFNACKGAFIHDKILSFPGGYQSKCGERGVKLSGGERQRIAIARVLLKRPKVVLLDEATSAMDSRTEEQVGVALKALMKGRTTFIIAHRLSSVVDADVIFVMKSGRIVEAGTHSELLNVKGTYSELWMKQSAQKQEGKEGP